MLVRYFVGLARFAPLVYLATALPTVVFMTYLTPPFEAPDETNHFRRIVQILRGQIVGHPISETESGGVIPKSAGELAESLSNIIGNPAVKLDPSVLRDMRGIRWNRGDKEYQTFPNTVIYPPFFYLPALGALAVGRAFDLGVLDSYQLARLATALTSVGIAAVAIGLAKRGKALLFVLLSLPTVLYLFASVSQDPLLVVSVALAVGICSRAAGSGRPLGAGERILVGVLIGAAIAARPPCFPLLALLLTRQVLPRKPRTGFSKWAMILAPFCLAVVIAGGWIVFGASPAKVPFRADEGVSIAGQLDYLRHHAGAIVDIAGRTLSGSGAWHYKQFVAALGWTDTYLPDLYYELASLALFAAASLSAFERGQALRPGEGLVLFAACVLSWIATYAVLYLTWTHVGAATVDGAQGRYFLAGAMLLVPALPALAFWRRPPDIQSRLGTVVAVAAWLFIFAFAALSDWFVPEVVLARFYL